MEQLLIIEDDIGLNQGLSKALKADNRQIISCQDLKTAKEQLLCGSVSLILLDINLPDGSGLDLLYEIKEKTPDMPVILLTANDTDMDIVLVDQPPRQLIVTLLCGLCLILIHRIDDIPHALHHQGAGPAQNTRLHLLHCPAVRRAGVIHAIFPANILRAQWTEGGHENQILRIHQRRVGKPQCQRLL